MDQDKARKVLEKHRGELLKMRNVVAVGIGYKISSGQKTDAISIVVSVYEKVPVSILKNEDVVPEYFEGVVTDVLETGELKKRAFDTRERPAPPGISVGHHMITAGTFGCVVKKQGERVILSNNHVLANSNDAVIGDLILQPGPYDGGSTQTDVLAELLEFVPIEFVEAPADCNIAWGIANFLNKCAELIGSQVRMVPKRMAAGDNLVDAALAKPLKDEDITDIILKIGAAPAGLAEAKLGMYVKKSGRTTEFTEGEVLQTDVAANVSYGDGLVAMFVDQFMMGPMSSGGDSGSAVLSADNELVGLLFAGSDQVTICNRITNVFNALGVIL